MAAKLAEGDIPSPRDREHFATQVDLDSSDAPIYVQLITLFRRQITTGAWPVEGRIPTIEALASEFGVANGTVRQALAFLEREGLVQRKRRRGTIVIARPDKPAYLALPTTRAGAVGFSAGFEREPVAAVRGASADTIALRYWRDGVAVMLEQARFGEAARTAIGEEALSERAPLESLEHFCGTLFDAIGLGMVVGTADTETAALLKIPVNAPVVSVRLSVRGRDGAELLETEWVLRGDMMQLVEHYPVHGEAATP